MAHGGAGGPSFAALHRLERIERAIRVLLYHVYESEGEIGYLGLPSEESFNEWLAKVGLPEYQGEEEQDDAAE
ncbi:MAG TPA: hypothetical protein VJA25_00140 [Dehalococcoidia bacterium]|nr:hypothetical protein [Dehalococcoidia bacterium]